VSNSLTSQALAVRGFTYVGRDPRGWLRFTGPLLRTERPHPVEVLVDPRGRKIPSVRLLEIPAALKPIAPHLSPDGTLCYLVEAAIVLDVFDRAGQVCACLDRAELVLSKVLRGEMIEDLEDEFVAYWDAMPCFLDAEPLTERPLEGVLFRPESSNSRFAITDDVQRTSKKLEALNGRGCKSVAVLVRRMRTRIPPRPVLAGEWPPRTVSALVAWQRTLDPAFGKQLEKRVAKAFRSGAERILFLIESPKLAYGFAVRFEKAPSFPSGTRRRFVDRKALLGNSEVHRLACHRIDDAYVAGRSNPGQGTLAGRRVLLIGCGTIGGFLADFLVKSGAGTASGELALADNDSMLPQNIGRHRLGFNSILRNKANALALELVRAHPGHKVTPLPVDALEIDLSTFDFVVDATGEEALGHLLVKNMQRPRFVPSLTVWIEGPGTAVRGLLRDVPGAACTRCLREADSYPVVEGELEKRFAGVGCEGLYVPFSVTASVQAACLALEMALDWSNTLSTPRLRTRILDGSRTKGVADLDPGREPRCPACCP
jgi:ThiF family/Prokaryotic E2 family B